MDHIRRRVLLNPIGVLAIIVIQATASFAEGPELLDYAFKEGILKIDVTFSKSKYVDGSNACKSEGTGFIVGSSYVVTAKHVYDFDQDCGKPTILATSFANKSQYALDVIGSSGDISLLKASDSLTSGYARTVYTLARSPCALWVMPPDGSQFRKNAIRYGVSEAQPEPDLIPIHIEENNGSEAPLVKITPIGSNHGESGGPIMRELLVVGMIEAKFPKTPTIGLMADTKEMNSLLNTFSVGIPPQSESCSPPLYSRREKQAILGTITAKVGIRDEHTIDGVVITPSDETFDSNTQRSLNEITRKAVEDSLNRLIPHDGVRVQTRIKDAGTVSFEIISEAPIPSSSLDSKPIWGPNSNMEFLTYLEMLPGVLEFDSKAVLNSAFERQIQGYANLKNLNDFELKPWELQLFDPGIDISRQSTLQSQETIFPNKLDTLWDQKLQKLDYGTKARLNDLVRKLEPPLSTFQ